MKKVMVRLGICALCFIMMTVSFIIGNSCLSVKCHPLVTDDQASLDHSKYYSAIKYGQVELTKDFQAEIIHAEARNLLIDKSAELCCALGKVSVGDLIYKYNGQQYHAESEIILTEINYLDNFIQITYHLSDNDYMIFYGSNYDYYSIEIGSTIRVVGNEVTKTTVERKELVGNKSIFYSSEGNFASLDNSNIVSVVIHTENNCYFIDNDFLTEYLGDSQYLIHIYNKYVEDEDQYYDKIITVNKYSNSYSLILSDNVYAYEKVLLTDDKGQLQNG